jgi:hypothetical protein
VVDARGRDFRYICVGECSFCSFRRRGSLTSAGMLVSKAQAEHRGSPWGDLRVGTLRDPLHEVGTRHTRKPGRYSSHKEEVEVVTTLAEVLDKPQYDTRPFAKAHEAMNDVEGHTFI